MKNLNRANDPVISEKSPYSGDFGEIALQLGQLLKWSKDNWYD